LSKMFMCIIQWFSVNDCHDDTERVTFDCSLPVLWSLFPPPTLLFCREIWMSLVSCSFSYFTTKSISYAQDMPTKRVMLSPFGLLLFFPDINLLVSAIKTREKKATIIKMQYSETKKVSFFVAKCIFFKLGLVLFSSWMWMDDLVQWTWLNELSSFVMRLLQRWGDDHLQSAVYVRMKRMVISPLQWLESVESLHDSLHDSLLKRPTPVLQEKLDNTCFRYAF
jgi:hypothetical protein